MQILGIKLRAVLTIVLVNRRVMVWILLPWIRLPVLLNTQFKIIKSAFDYINLSIPDLLSEYIQIILIFSRTILQTRSV